MKDFIQFAFGFLFVRNWDTGRKELSRARTTVFCVAIFLVLFALTVISVLQAPVEVFAE